jgi:hypothetical protein
MVAKAERARANQVESRLSEEVAELASTAKAIANLRSNSAERGAQRVDDKFSALGQSDLALGDKPRELGQLNPLMLQPQTVVAQNISTPTPTRGIEAISAPQPLEIHNVKFEHGENQAALSLQCALGNHGTVGVSIIKGDSAGLKVVVEPGSGVTASALLKDRAAIQSRLSALGIKVASLEVGQGETPAFQSRSGSRKLSKDDEYEDTFA